MAVEEGSGQDGNTIKLCSSGADANRRRSGNVSDDDTNYIGENDHGTKSTEIELFSSSAEAPGTYREDKASAHGRHIRMVVIAAVCVLVLSTVTSTIVVVVYHNTNAKSHEMTPENNTSSGGVAHDTVAFNAYLSGTDLVPTVGQPIIFNKEVQNYAHAYNTSDGMFTPPIAGVYHFSVQICMSQKDRVAVQLVSARRVYAAGAFQEEYDATCYSMTTVAVLEKGEKMWVKCVERKDNEGSERAIKGNTPGKFRTMFNGLLIQPIA